MAKTKEAAPKLPPRTEVTGVITPSLTHADRCDSCGAQALVRVLLAFSDLLFCGNHYRRHADALTAQGFTVQQDTREWKDAGR